MSHRTITVSGPDQWCFGIEFWVQAALFERTGFSDFSIRYDVTTGALSVRRNSLIRAGGGIVHGEAGIEATVTPPRLDAQRFSWKAVQAWARDAVAGMTFTDWRQPLTEPRTTATH